MGTRGSGTSPNVCIFALGKAQSMINLNKQKTKRSNNAAERLRPIVSFSTVAAHSQLLGGDFISESCLLTCGAPTSQRYLPLYSLQGASAGSSTTQHSAVGAEDFYRSLGLWDIRCPPRARLVLVDSISEREHASISGDALINTRAAYLGKHHCDLKQERITESICLDRNSSVAILRSKPVVESYLGSPAGSRGSGSCSIRSAIIQRESAFLDAFFYEHSSITDSNILNILKSSTSTSASNLVLLTSRSGDLRWFDLRNQRYVARQTGHSAAVKQLLLMDERNVVTIDHQGCLKHWYGDFDFGDKISSASISDFVSCVETVSNVHASTSILQRKAVVVSAQVLSRRHFVTSGLDGAVMLHKI